MLRRPSLLAALLLAASCTSTEELGNASSGGSTSSATEDTGSTSLPDSTGALASSSSSAGSTSDTTTGAVDSSSSDGGGSFVGLTEGACDELPGGVLAHCFSCDPLEQDCNEGEACKPWANDGSGVWNTSRCSPLVDGPGQRGEPCTMEDAPGSGIDSCDAGLMCWNVDPDTLEGACVELCRVVWGCEEPTETCARLNQGVVPVCLPACDPLASTCDDGFGCYPNGGDTFSCIREGELVHTGTVSHPECPAGQLQVAGGRSAGCEPGEFCCRSYCDTSAVDPCGADVPCVPFFDEVTEGFENLGYCGA